MLDFTVQTTDQEWRLVPDSLPQEQELPNDGLFGFLLHDFQLGNYWGNNRVGKTRWYPRTHGDPETVKTYFKEDRVSLSPAWQEFHKLLFTLCAFGKADILLFDALEQAFDSTMAPNRVITNNRGFPEGYMCLGMGGNIIKLKNPAVYHPNSLFGDSYKIETLDGSKPPPDVEEVFFEKPWLWSKATVARYAFPEDNIQGLDSSWQHVIPFPQLDRWNAHVPLLNITNQGWNYIQVSRISTWDQGFIPNPYNPSLVKSYP